MAIKDLTLVTEHLFICNGGSCKNKGAEESTCMIREEIKDAGFESQIHTTKTLCNGRCNDGPIVIAMQQGNWYKGITPEKSRQFVKDRVLELKEDPALLLFSYGSQKLTPLEL